MNNIQITARIQLDGVGKEKVQSVAEDCIERVRKQDPGTQQYDWFISEDGTECVVRETYDDSDAVLAHLNNLDDLLGQLTGLGTMSVEVYGDVSEELRNTLVENCTFYDFIQGL